MPNQPTLVAIHAHPDDESIFTGGLLARAALAGWRTVVVLATSGEVGSTPGFDVSLDVVGSVRRDEAARACAALGVDELVVLPYRDSGQAAAGHGPHSLAAAPVDEVVDAIVERLAGELVTAVTSYDAAGTYGHPDHLAVHRAGRRLAVLGWPVYEATMDRAHLHRLRDELVGRRALAPWVWPADLNARLGVDDRALVHLPLAGTEELARKLAAVAEHGSQVAFAPEFMGIPPGAFHRLLEHEWYAPVDGRVGPFDELVTGVANLVAS